MVLVFDAQFDVTSSLGFSDSFYFILVLCVDRRRENQSAAEAVSFFYAFYDIAFPNDLVPIIKRFIHATDIATFLNSSNLWK